MTAANFNISYDAPKTVAMFMASDAKMRVIKGPQGSGKSSGSVMEILRRMQEQEPDWDGVRRSRWLVVRNTFPQLRLTTIKTFLDWIPDGTLGEWKATEKTYQFQFNDIEAEAIFLALDTADDVQKLLSLESTGCYFNEFREIQSAIYEGMTRRVGRYPSKKSGPGPSWYGIWADTNPPQIGSWHHRMMENLDENLDPLPDRTDTWAWDVYHQPSGRADDAENLENLPVGYYDTEGLTPDYVTTMIDGEYGPSQSGLPVFRATFVDALHVAKNLLYVDRAPVIGGVDAGLTPAFVFAQELPSGKVNVLGSIATGKGETMGMKRFIKDRVLPWMRANMPGRYPAEVTLCLDPACWQRGQANEVTVAETVAAFGFRVVKAPTNTLDNRISAVEQLLQRRVGQDISCQIDSGKARGLVNALSFGYIFKKNKAGDVGDNPDKNIHSHVADAFQYLALMIMGAQFDIRAGRSRQAREIKPAKYRYA